MGENITLERVDDVPAESRICHYDELGEAAKERLPALTDEPESAVGGTVVDGFHDCDLVKYTDYYEISVR
ncbi:hypothetical protein [Natronobacterium texcoconense]|uniref:DUF7979 domain-containing protein n=1 Tax=Natronobacterium texcoconense TaxID=1095778 RepID=A0A1H1GE04_NATTX|nr:hypothetical protein [Natronobacterium texcoconense]SDR11128.1 hypothetical protein SAMN04489842_2377 [Natronobacterium texcoconense]